MTEGIIIIVVSILFIFGLGYALGRRVGTKQGYQLGSVQAGIDLRINALEQGICPICRYRCAAVKKDEEQGLDYHHRREY